MSKIAGLSTLRYDEEEIRTLLSRLQERMMLPLETFELSWLYNDAIALGDLQARAARRRATNG